MVTVLFTSLPAVQRIPGVSTGHIFSNIPLLSFIFMIIAILMAVRWHLIEGLIYNSLINSDIDFSFVFLLTICVSFFGKCLVRSIGTILVRVFALLYLGFHSLV